MLYKWILHIEVWSITKEKSKILREKSDWKSYAQILDDRMVRIDFKNSSASHELQAWRVTKCLCFHEPVRFKNLMLGKQVLG
jgi:hypothetical protein